MYRPDKRIRSHKYIRCDELKNSSTSIDAYNTTAGTGAFSSSKAGSREKIKIPVTPGRSSARSIINCDNLVERSVSMSKLNSDEAVDFISAGFAEEDSVILELADILSIPSSTSKEHKTETKRNIKSNQNSQFILSSSKLRIPSGIRRDNKLARTQPILKVSKPELPYSPSNGASIIRKPKSQLVHRSNVPLHSLLMQRLKIEDESRRRPK